MSLCDSVFRSIETAATEQGFHRVKTVWLEIGVLSCVEAESMRFCFDVVGKNTIGEGARLIIEETKANARCVHCDITVPVKERYDPCPQCGHFPLTLITGDELRIKELEVE